MEKIPKNGQKKSKNTKNGQKIQKIKKIKNLKIQEIEKLKKNSKKKYKKNGKTCQQISKHGQKNPKILKVKMQEHTSIIHMSSIIVARRPVYVRLALWFLHHTAWMESHTGGSRLTPTVHPCPVQLGRLWVAYVVYEPNERQ